MDYLDSILGAALAAAGWWAGRRWPRRKTYEPPKPICGCGHNVSFHRDHKGACGAMKRDIWPCGCQKYAGPEPLPEYF